MTRKSMRKITVNQAIVLRKRLLEWKKASNEYDRARKGLHRTKRGGKAYQQHSKRLKKARKKLVRLNRMIRKAGFKHFSHAKKYLESHGFRV